VLVEAWNDTYHQPNNDYEAYERADNNADDSSRVWTDLTPTSTAAYSSAFAALSGHNKCTARVHTDYDLALSFK
jgi:hypothetical protein